MVESSSIVDNASSYEPTLEDTFFIIPSGDYQRLIFTHMELREREETHLNDFRNFLKVKGLTLPAGYDDESRTVLRFLQGLKWNYQQSYDEILEHAKWRDTANLTNIEPFLQHLNSGIIYGLKRDKNLRPIIVVNVRRVINSKMALEPLMATVDYFTNYVIEKGMVPGRVECWTCIFDLSDVGATEIPTKHI